MENSITGLSPLGKGPFLHPSDDDLEMYGSLRLRPEQATQIHSHVLTCELCRSKLGPATPANEPHRRETNERRKHIRVPLDAPIRLRAMDPAAPLLEGRIVNISRNGLKVRLNQPLQPGVAVQARMGGRIVMAEVRYCVPEGAEFHVGVEIQDVFPIPEKSPNQ